MTSPEPEFVVVPESRNETTNCRQFAPVRRRAADPQVPGYTEFVDLWGRGVKIQPSYTGDVPAVLLLYGTDPLLLQTVAADLGISEGDVSTLVSVLSSSARLCPKMAKEAIRALQEFVAEHPDCEGQDEPPR